MESKTVDALTRVVAFNTLVGGNLSGISAFPFIGVAVPHYFFDIKNGHRLVDPAGLSCADDTEAIAKAQMIALQIGQNKPSSDIKRHIAVIDDTGGEISRIYITPDSPNK